MDDYKTLLMVASAAISFLNYAYYVTSAIKGAFKPHAFSWGVWSLLSVIAFAAQWSENAGPGMWQNAVMALGTFTVAATAYVWGSRDYTRSDWVALATAVLAIPLWLVTKDALWSVVLITVIDIIAFWPTIRKSWADPATDSPAMFFVSGLICALGIGALAVFNWTTVLYPAALVVLNWGFVVMLYARRAAIARPA